MSTNKGYKSAFFSSSSTSSSQKYTSSFQSSSSSSKTVTTSGAGGATSSTFNSTSYGASSSANQSTKRRSSATAAITSSPTLFNRNERPYSSVRGPLGQSYSGNVTGAALGALGSFGNYGTDKYASSINRPLALPRSASENTGGSTFSPVPPRSALSPVPQGSTWDAKPYSGSSVSSGNISSSTRPPPVPSLPSSSYSSPSLSISSPSRISSPFGSTSSTSSSNVERYNLRYQKGYVLIFHHKHFKNAKHVREGSEKDLQLLKHFFTKYRVKKPDICENYTVLRIKDKMKNISKKDFGHYSCLLVIVMSHGETKDHIMAYDDFYNFEAEVVERVLMNATLKDKPKLFFIQACKGNARMQVDATPVASNKNDLLKCYSTYEGTVSLRDIVSGTYFIQILFELIEQHGDKDVSELMILLRARFRDDRIPQAPTDTSTLTKKFYFRDLK